MAMKREVLRLGGYEREFFISQTPELTAMANAVIDLDALASTSSIPASILARRHGRDAPKNSEISENRRSTLFVRKR